MSNHAHIHYVFFRRESVPYIKKRLDIKRGKYNKMQGRAKEKLMKQDWIKRNEETIVL